MYDGRDWLNFTLATMWENLFSWKVIQSNRHLIFNQEKVIQLTFRAVADYSCAIINSNRATCLKEGAAYVLHFLEKNLLLESQLEVNHIRCGLTNLLKALMGRIASDVTWTSSWINPEVGRSNFDFRVEVEFKHSLEVTSKRLPATRWFWRPLRPSSHPIQPVVSVWSKLFH